jgi:queuine/archaeosine tRNA-ribosyltransferase
MHARSISAGFAQQESFPPMPIGGLCHTKELTSRNLMRMYMFVCVTPLVTNKIRSLYNTKEPRQIIVSTSRNLVRMSNETLKYIT